MKYITYIGEFGAGAIICVLVLLFIPKTRSVLTFRLKRRKDNARKDKFWKAQLIAQLLMQEWLSTYTL